MSSLRNAVKRVTHKERSQPQNRSQFGLLEKKKDYKERSTDHHRKQDRIQAARQKAAFRNPDEFYFGMKNAQVDRTSGKHRKTQAAEQRDFETQVGVDTVRIMKDQDLSYVRMQKQKDVKKMERLQSSLHFIEGGGGDGGGGDTSTTSAGKKRKHTVFVDTQQEAESFNVAEHFDTLPVLAGRAFNRPRVSTLQQSVATKLGGVTGNDDATSAPSDAFASATTTATDTAHATTTNDLLIAARDAKRLTKKVAKARAASYAELQARSKRVAALERAEAHLVTEKLVAGKGRKRKIVPAENGRPAIYQWRRKRSS